MALAIYTDVDRYALQHFKGCHNRVRDGKCPSIHWSRDREGYLAFCRELGPIPSDMQKPSVGRINHDRGYEPGNVRWEEHRHNSVKRCGTKFEGCLEPLVEFRARKFKVGTPEHRLHQTEASRKRWSDPAQKEAARARMLGNKFQKGEV